METAENLGTDHNKKIKYLEEQTETLLTRSAKMTIDFKNVTWRIDKLEKGGVSGEPTTNETVDDTSLDTGDSGRLLNRMMTSVKKLEMQMADFKDKKDIDAEFAAVYVKIDLVLSMKSEASTEPVGTALSPEELEKLASTFKKIDELEKQLIIMQSELRVYEEAKLISSLQ